MKGFLQRLFRADGCRHNFEVGQQITSVDSIDMNPNTGGGYVTLTTKCLQCGKINKHFQTRGINHIPKVNSILWYPARRGIRVPHKLRNKGFTIE